MFRENRHNLLMLLLAVAVVFAPVQSAVSAIAMLGHATGSTQHCQMEMMDHGDMDSMQHDGCCKHDGACQDSCSSCSQCFSLHAMIIGTVSQTEHPLTIFTLQQTSLFEGIPPGTELRPPRLLS